MLSVAIGVGITGCSGVAEAPAPEVVAEQEDSEPTQPADGREPRLPEASPVFDNRWPTDFSRQELSDTALARMNAFIDEQVASSEPVVIETAFQDNIDPWHWDWMTNLATFSVTAFSDYPVPDPLFIAGTDQEFMIAELEARGREMHPEGGVCGHVMFDHEVGGCAYKGTVWQSMALPDETMFDDIQKALLSIIPHEYFHLVQDNLDPGPGGQVLPPGDPLYRPVWLVEGSASFVGDSLLNYSGLGTYDDNYPWFAAYAPPTNDGILTYFEKYEGGIGPYDYGRLATEYIVASVGVESLMNVWVYMGEGDPFETAFERAVGISVADFYEAYDQVIVTLEKDGIALSDQ